MSILLYFERSCAHGRLHRAWWALSRVYQKSMYTLFRFVQETHTHSRTARTNTRAHPSQRCACLLLCLPNTKGICARVCAPDSLFHIFWESFVYQKEFYFFLKMVVFSMWPNKWFEHRFLMLPTEEFPLFQWISSRKSDFSSTIFANGRLFYERKCNANGKRFQMFLSCQNPWQT